ncbi:uL15 family ribosomal protein, partial [Candidatus Parcubacteria bacterium]|nr:uL15 family ribosomal protein [Candidatus Parcubacteria bacterium]
KQLVEMGWLKKVPRDGVKILGVGTLAKALNFSGFEYSKTAVGKIEKAGGTVSYNCSGESPPPGAGG